MHIFYEFQQRYIYKHKLRRADRMTEKHKKNKGDIMSKFLFAFLCVFRKKIP